MTSPNKEVRCTCFYRMKLPPYMTAQGFEPGTSGQHTTSDLQTEATENAVLVSKNLYFIPAPGLRSQAAWEWVNCCLATMQPWGLWRSARESILATSLKWYSVLKNIFEIDNYNAALRWYTCTYTVCSLFNDIYNSKCASWAVLLPSLLPSLLPFLLPLFISTYAEIN